VAPSFEGTRCTGYRFGSGGPILARLYNNSTKRHTRHDEGYFALLATRHPAAFDPERDVWRLEFQLRREGMRSFRLAPELEGVERGEEEERAGRGTLSWRSRQSSRQKSCRGWRPFPSSSLTPMPSSSI